MNLTPDIEWTTFLETPWSIAWLALLIVLIYGWHRLRAVYSSPRSSMRRFSQGDTSTNSQSLRLIAAILYASGGIMLLLASPVIVAKLVIGQSDPTLPTLLSVLGLADLIAGIVLLRMARNREHMAGQAIS